jgi:hypothetical protein
LDSLEERTRVSNKLKSAAKLRKKLLKKTPNPKGLKDSLQRISWQKEGDESV